MQGVRGFLMPLLDQEGYQDVLRVKRRWSAALKSRYIAVLEAAQKATEPTQYDQGGAALSESIQSSGMSESAATHPVIVSAKPAVTAARWFFSFRFAQTEVLTRGAGTPRSWHR